MYFLKKGLALRLAGQTGRIMLGPIAVLKDSTPAARGGYLQKLRAFSLTMEHSKRNLCSEPT